jgi:hypothetical protein
VVTAEQDRQAPTAQLGIQRVVQQLVPLHHFGQVAVALHCALAGVSRTAKVAAVFHVYAQSNQGLRQTGHAQCLRPHAGAQRAGANVGGHADQAYARGLGNGGGIHVANANACKADCKEKFLRAAARKVPLG